MDTKEMAQGYEENIKRAFDIIEKCKKQDNNFSEERETYNLKTNFRNSENIV